MYISIAAVIGGAESWNEVEEFGHLKEDFFASRIKGFSGVPSHDTFNRVFWVFVWIRSGYTYQTANNGFT